MTNRWAMLRFVIGMATRVILFRHIKTVAMEEYIFIIGLLIYTLKSRMIPDGSIWFELTALGFISASDL